MEESNARITNLNYGKGEFTSLAIIRLGVGVTAPVRDQKRTSTRNL